MEAVSSAVMATNLYLGHGTFQISPVARVNSWQVFRFLAPKSKGKEQG